MGSGSGARGCRATGGHTTIAPLRLSRDTAMAEFVSCDTPLARRASRVLLLVAALLLSSCSHPPPVTGCAAAGGLTPVCGLTNPEDLELLPDGRSLLISQMGAMDGARPGALAFFDTGSGILTRLPDVTQPATENWGSTGCNTPPGNAFSPHGIDMRERPDGRRELLVVNHGGRESVELFEVLGSAGNWQLAWRGCVLPPAGTYMNDVAGLADGDFLISHMFPRDAWTVGGMNLYLLRGMLGFDTGVVFRCTRNAGCSAVPGTAAPFPNGIQVDATGTTLFLNAYLAGEVRKISLADGRLLGTARIRAPDNSQWNPDGTLLVASQTASPFEMSACFEVRSGACAAAFDIVELDPATMSTRTILSHAGAPMGAATVAQRVGNTLYIGTFAGDRMVYAELPAETLRPPAPRSP